MDGQVDPMVFKVITGGWVGEGLSIEQLIMVNELIYENTEGIMTNNVFTFLVSMFLQTSGVYSQHDSI